MEIEYFKAKELAEQIVINLDDDSFLSWLDLADGDKEALNRCLKRFEEIEAYEKCAIIRDYINMVI